jgi:Glycosyl hydrolase family 26
MRVRALVAALLLTLVLAGPASASRIYWGAWIGPQFTGTSAPFDWRAERKFIEMVKRRPSIVHFYSPFAHGCESDGCSFYRFNRRAFARVRRHGMIPMISWSSASTPIQRHEPDFQNADIVAGRYDRYIRRWARAARDWGHPFFLRFNREMNGTWYPWAAGVNGNTAADFVAVWRHVHRIFAKVGAANATWVWCPNVDPGAIFTPFGKVYPGRRYVNWTCLDGYNFGTPWRSFDVTYHRSYRILTHRLARRKPLIIGEVASVEAGGSKARWIRRMLRSRLPSRYPRVKGFLWFNARAGGHNWPIESSRGSKRAFRRDIAAHRYAPASRKLSRLRWGRIRPLR